MEPDGSVYFIDASGNKKHVVRGVENVRKLGIVSGTTYSLYNGKTWDFYSLENDTRLFGGYEDASGLGNGVAAVKQGRKWGLINGSGEALTQPVFDGIVQDEKTVVCRNERLFAKKGTKYLMIDAAGTQIGTQTFDDARLFADTTYAAVRQNGKWGFVDKDGTVVIPLQYEDARSFSNGLAAVKKGKKWGFVDLENNMVIAPQFEDVRDFNSSGNVFVELDSPRFGNSFFSMWLLRYRFCRSALPRYFSLDKVFRIRSAHHVPPRTPLCPLASRSRQMELMLSPPLNRANISRTMAASTSFTLMPSGVMS